MKNEVSETQSKSDRYDPDTRFLLANERTLLAWIRTSIALQAGGLALAHFSTNVVVQRVISILIVGIGGWMALTGYLRFRAADRAIRTNQLPSIGRTPAIQACSIIVIAIVLIVGLAFGIK